jgi:hypothetical protein
MSLDKAVKHGKEHRKPYRGSKAFDPACRDNTCPYCLSNKKVKDRRRKQAADEALQELVDDAQELGIYDK